MNKKIDYYMALNWSYRFEWSDEDNCYVASIAELKGCMADGKDIEEASMQIKDALYSYIYAALEAGYNIPEPLKKNDFKGKILYRTTSDRHYKIAKRAKSLNISINQFVDRVLEEKLKEKA